MKKPELLCDKESFKILGINETKTEAWEDGMRVKDTTKPGTFEWWYFDVHSDNGYIIVGGLHYNVSPQGKIEPFLTINFANGENTICDIRVEQHDKPHSFSETSADTHIGKSFFKSLDGLNKYHVYINADENQGYGMDIIIDRLAPSYRPGTGVYGFAENGPLFGWFCAVPGGVAKGSITFNGQNASIDGSAYHDHNWGNCAMNEIIDNWLWSRGEVDGITIVSSTVRFIPELGGGEGAYLYMIKDNKLLMNAINSEIVALAGAPYNHPKTNKPTTTKCSYTYDDDKSKVIVSFYRVKDLAIFPFDSSSTEWRCWYTRYNATVNVLTIDKTKNTSKELNGAVATLEVMDFKGEKIKKG